MLMSLLSSLLRSLFFVTFVPFLLLLSCAKCFFCCCWSTLACTLQKAAPSWPWRGSLSFRLLPRFSSFCPSILAGANLPRSFPQSVRFAPTRSRRDLPRFADWSMTLQVERIDFFGQTGSPAGIGGAGVTFTQCGQ